MTEMCIAAANYIIERTNDFNNNHEYGERILITGKRLQKLLFFSDAEFMKRNGQSMFTEDFCAWPSGPVIPSVYSEFSQYQNGEMCPSKNCNQHKLMPSMTEAIDFILNETWNMDTLDLVNHSHVENGPWMKFYNPNDPEHNQIISKDDIKQFYLENEMFQTN